MKYKSLTERKLEGCFLSRAVFKRKFKTRGRGEKIERLDTIEVNINILNRFPPKSIRKISMKTR